MPFFQTFFSIFSSQYNFSGPQCFGMAEVSAEAPSPRPVGGGPPHFVIRGYVHLPFAPCANTVHGK